MRKIFSLYWPINIVPNIVSSQKRILNKFGYEIVQDGISWKRHGEWLDDVMHAADDEDVLLFLDIDAFPLNREIVEIAFAAAEQGTIFGAGQTCNHLGDPNMIYAAPMFLCIAKRTWEQLGRPSMRHSATDDAAQFVTRAALAAGIPVEIRHPIFTGRPMWRYGPDRVTGHLTFYDGGIFHLFETRKQWVNDKAFQYVVDCVLNDQKVDFLHVAEMMRGWPRLRAQLLPGPSVVFSGLKFRLGRPFHNAVRSVQKRRARAKAARSTAQ